MAGNKKFPSDLLLVAGLVIITDIFMLIPVLNETFIRTALGLPMVLFLPGYALIAMLFPEKNGLESMERIALSVGISVVIVPLIGLVLNFTPWGILEIPLLVSVSLFTILMCGLAQVRRIRLPEDRRFGASFKDSSLSLVAEFLEKPESKTENTLRIFLALSFLVLIGALTYVAFVPQEKEAFTEFYILGPERMAENYKTEYIQGESGTYIVGITNNEYKTMNYTMEVKLENKLLPLPERLQNIKLDHKSTLEEPLEITPSIEGKDMQLEFLLFNETEKNIPYKDLRLWINVTEEV